MHSLRQQVHGALTSAWHVAVIDGPDTGWVSPVPPTGLILGRGTAPAEGAQAQARMTLHDPQVSRDHCTLRVRNGRVQVRDLGSANGTHVAGSAAAWPPCLRQRRQTGRSRALRSGEQLVIGSSVLEVRRRPEELRAPRPPEAATPRRRDWLRIVMPLVMCLVMVPLLLSVSAGWWRWLILAMPLTMLAAALLSGRPARAEPLPDPATVLLLAASGAPPAPAGEVLRAHLPPTGTRRPSRRPGGRRARARDTVELHDGDRIALIGPGAPSAARWLLGQLASHQGADVQETEPLTGPAGHGPHLSSGRGEEGWHVQIGHGTAPPPGHPGRGRQRAGGTVHVTVAPSVDAVPHWCTRVMTVADCQVGEAWLAAVLSFGRKHQESSAELPSQVTLETLLGPADLFGQAWGRDPGLRAALGVGAGLEDLDLAAQGPHALVAGTTGSGKSELLLAWMLGLAAHHSPADLQLVLIDYKGGATFGRLAELPHTAGVLTDLEPASTVRAVQSLQAEVRRRERELAGAGVKDLAAYRAARATGGDTPSMPRLVVVVDEFRELAESHGEILHALVRLATQGRSLGIHLILATQRPGGSVSAEIRANLTLRICLRVLEAAESQDVIGVGDAARLPRIPGRALVRADDVASEVQAAWCGDGTWVEEAIAAANETWRRQGLGPPPRPWAPELPRRIHAEDVLRSPAVSLPEVTPAESAAPGLLLGLADLPGEQKLAPCRWRPGGLLVLGGPRSGRTTALRTLTLGALHHGLPVHVLAAGTGGFGDLRAPRLGTVASSGDPRRAARLLEILSSAPTQALLVVDDAETVAEDLDAVAGAGQGPGLLGRALRDGLRLGHHVVLAGPPSLAGARWTEPLRDRLVLAPRSVSEALTAGVPRELAGVAGLPGRAVLVEPAQCTVLHVAMEQRSELPGPVDSSVPRVLPLPASVPRSELSRHAGGAVVLGLGGDAAEPVPLDCSPGSITLVMGPPGSGRTTALDGLAHDLSRTGTVARLSPGAGPGGPALAGPGSAVLLDDVERWAPHRLDELATTLAGRAVIASARTETVTSAYRGTLADWRAQATLVVLSPDPSVQRLVSADLSTAIDPVTRRPGLGIVVTHGRAVPVQVAQA